MLGRTDTYGVTVTCSAGGCWKAAEELQALWPSERVLPEPWTLGQGESCRFSLAFPLHALTTVEPSENSVSDVSMLSAFLCVEVIVWMVSATLFIYPSCVEHSFFLRPALRPTMPQNLGVSKTVCYNFGTNVVIISKLWEVMLDWIINGTADFSSDLLLYTIMTIDKCLSHPWYDLCGWLGVKNQLSIYRGIWINLLEFGSNLWTLVVLLLPLLVLLLLQILKKHFYSYFNLKENLISHLKQSCPCAGFRNCWNVWPHPPANHLLQLRTSSGRPGRYKGCHSQVSFFLLFAVYFSDKFLRLNFMKWNSTLFVLKVSS